MAKDEALPLDLVGGSNLTKIKHDAANIWKKYQKLEEERTSINEQMAAYRADLVAMGIPRSSFSEVKRRAKLEAQQRRAHDFGVQVFGEAIGAKLDLFENADERTDENPRSNPESGGAKPQTKPKAKGAKSKPAAKGATPKAKAKSEPASRPLAGLEKVIEDAERTSKEREKTLN